MAMAHLQLLLPPILTQPLPSRMDSTPLLQATWATPVQQLLQVQNSVISNFSDSPEGIHDK